MASSILTAEILRERLNYDPNTGIFSRARVCGGRPSGEIVSGKNHEGYIRIRVAGKKYFAQRLAWLYVYGEWPKNKIDHINGNITDNRICNLRDVSDFVSAQNVRKPRGKNKLLGVITVREGVYRSEVSFKDGDKRRRVHLGYFRCAEDAHKAYVAAKKELHPGFVWED